MSLCRFGFLRCQSCQIAGKLRLIRHVLLQGLIGLRQRILKFSASAVRNCAQYSSRHGECCRAQLGLCPSMVSELWLWKIAAAGTDISPSSSALDCRLCTSATSLRPVRSSTMLMKIRETCLFLKAVIGPTSARDMYVSGSMADTLMRTKL